MSTSPLLAVEGVTIVYGTRTVLDAVTLGVMPGERIGVVGRNGGGKTTLVEVLAGVREPDAGRVVRTGGTSVQLVSQDHDAPGHHTLAEYLFGDQPPHTWASKPLVREVLDGLVGGVGATGYPHGMTTSLAAMSGGQRRKAELARALMQDSDVVILDEPTNHLEIEAIDWLAGFITRRRGATVLVTHDRWFLDACCTGTWEVADGSVHKYEGGYAAFVLARAERQRREDVTEERRQNLLRKELAWLRRGAPARTSKPKFRIAAAEALISNVPAPRDSVNLMQTASARLGKKVVNLHDASFAPAAHENPVFEALTWNLAPGTRYGLLGPNGIGKTTLLNAIASAAGVDVHTAPDKRHGRIEVGTTVVVGVLSQMADETPADVQVLPYVESLRPMVEVDGNDITARSLLERFGFTGNRLTTFIRDLSGGEKRRLALLTVLLAGPNVLLLDEPTNDLDTDTAAEFEDLLDTWPGTVVSVSHDRYFLERTCDQMYALLPQLGHPAHLRHLVGGVEQYLALRNPVQAPVGQPAAAAATKAQGPTGAEIHAARKNVQRIERRLAKIDELLAALSDEVEQSASDYERLQNLLAQMTELTAEKQSLEEQWLESADIAGSGQ
ncbi:MAG: ABC transporter ATP-binding protein [Actinobacteria bacterium]|nr:ABC transporter ATP-binding protein [Actinomycetota bacterium]